MTEREQIIERLRNMRIEENAPNLRRFIEALAPDLDSKGWSVINCKALRDRLIEFLIIDEDEMAEYGFVRLPKDGDW